MWVVVDELEILVAEREDILDIRIDNHLRERTRVTRKLQTSLLKVVEVEVRIAGGMDEVAHLKVAYLCHHLKQEGIAGDVERYAEEGVCTTLVELEREYSPTPFYTRRSHIELEEAMAWREGHVRNICHVPCAAHDAAGVRSVAYLLDYLLNLVDVPSVGGRP